MASWLHTTILATSVAATVAVGFASASIATGDPVVKGDRLPVVTASAQYVTVETRSDSQSILNRIQID